MKRKLKKLSARNEILYFPASMVMYAKKGAASSVIRGESRDVLEVCLNATNGGPTTGA